MFEMKFQISKKEYSRLKEYKSINEFQNDYCTVLGQIKMDFNQQEVGFLNNDFLEVEEILLCWMVEVNRVAVECKLQQESMMELPENNHICLKFKVLGEAIVVSEYRDKGSTLGKWESGKEEILDWKESIDKNEFYFKVEENRKRFLLEIKSINPVLLNYITIKKLADLNDC